jgi:hypothetical protein
MPPSLPPPRGEPITHRLQEAIHNTTGPEPGPSQGRNQRGHRLSVRGAHDIITSIAAGAGHEDDTTVHTERHTFATTLVRGGTGPRDRRRAPRPRQPRNDPRLHPAPAQKTAHERLTCSSPTDSAPSGPITPFGLMLAVPR